MNNSISNGRLNEETIKQLKEIVGEENISTEPYERYLYSMDVYLRRHNPPDVIVRPKSTLEVSRIVQLAYEHEIPITPRGAGTGITGGAIPIKGGILIDMTRMNRILEIDLDNRCVTLEAGVIHAELNKVLSKYGFFFPPEPGSSKMCTMGGLVSIGGSGIRAVKYGTAKDYVLSLTVVLPNGEVLKTGKKVLKRAAGYNLTQLFVGSEGTLGVITEMTLKIMPLPENYGIAMAVYEKLEDAARTVRGLFQAGVIPSAIEILDETAIQAVNKYRPSLRLPNAEGILLFEVEGSSTEVKRQASTIGEICRENGASQYRWSDDPTERERLWEARRVVGVATGKLDKKRSRVYEAEDFAVPISKIVEVIRKVREISKKHKIPAVIFGHIGDGNLHVAPLLDKKNRDEWARLDRLVDEVQRFVISIGGSISAEHGIGMLREEYVELENGPVAMRVMRGIKRLFDPKNIMNPGKMALG